MANPEIHLRLYHPSDFEALYRIDQACFPKGIAYGRDRLRAYLNSEGARCLLAAAGHKIAGFILTDGSFEIGHIVTLDVLEPFRRQNVGSLLLESAENQAAARGVRLMVLETATTNKAAIALWKKHGYRQFGKIANYYGNGQDAFRMQKILRPKSA